MKYCKILFYVIIAAIFLSSCEQFDDGGSRYQSRKNIIGVWKYYEVMRSGVPVENADFDSTYKKSTIEFEKGSTVHFYWKNSADSLLKTQTANYVFNHNKQTMRITFESYPTENQTYFVKRLEKNEFWLEYYDEDGVMNKLKLYK